MAAQLIPGATLQSELHSYTISRSLSERGSGSVYLAFYTKHERRIEVAIKVIERTRDLTTDVLERETANLHQLDHLCLPRIVESFANDEQYFIVTEYIVGPTLQDFVGGSVQPNQEQRPLLRAIILPLLNVVEYLHANQPPHLHHDIKPRNIVLPSMHKRIVLVDLGLTHPYRAVDQSIIPPVSPGYSPPEQYRGYAEERSDFYAIGATLYFVLTGEQPPISTLRKGDDLAELLRSYYPDVSDKMQAVIAGLMAVEIEQRYADIDAIRADLEQAPELNAHVPIRHGPLATDAAVAPTQRTNAATAPAATAPAARPATAPSAPAAPAPTTGRRRSLWLWGGLLTVLVLLGSVALSGALGGADPPTPTVAGSSEQAIVASVPAASAASSVAPSAEPSLAPTVAPTPSAPPEPTLTPSPQPTATPALADVAGRIAFFSEQGISIYSAGSRANNISMEAADASPRWSPDGAQLAFVSYRTGNRDIFVMDADGENVQQLTDDPADDTYPTWSPDGTQIAFVSERDGLQNVYVVDVMEMSIEPLTMNMNSTVRYEDLAWSPDGRLAVALQRNEVWNIHLINEDGSDMPVTTNPNPFTVQIKAPAWHPDSQQIAFMSNVGGPWNVYTTDLDGESRPITNNTDQSIFISQPVWSPDGEQIGFISRSIVTEGDQQAYSYSLNVIDAEADDAEPQPVIVDRERLDDPDWIR